MEKFKIFRAVAIVYAAVSVAAVIISFICLYLIWSMCIATFCLGQGSVGTVTNTSFLFSAPLPTHTSSQLPHSILIPSAAAFVPPLFFCLHLRVGFWLTHHHHVMAASCLRLFVHSPIRQIHQRDQLTISHLCHGQIEVRKTEWNAKSKIGSLDNATHVPGGGDKKVCFVVEWLLYTCNKLSLSSSRVAWNIPLAQTHCIRLDRLFAQSSASQHLFMLSPPLPHSIPPE